MRFPEPRSLLAACAACAALAAQATPEAVRSALAERLRQQLPALSAADYAAGASIDAGAEGTGTPGASAAIEAGRRLWTRKFSNGRSLAGCFPNGGRRVAATYPQYHPRLKRVITLEMAVNQCLKAHGEALLEPGDASTMGAITAYVRSLAAGQKIAVRVPAAAQPRFEEGRRLYFSRMGQRNYACASCHVQGAGRRFDDRVLSPAIGQAARWPAPAQGGATTLQGRIRECLELMGAAPFPAGSDELNHLEYFLTYLSNGLALRPNTARASTATAPGS